MAAKYAVKALTGSLIPDSEDLQYTVPATLDRIAINACRIVNTSGAAVDLDLWIVPKGGSTADQYKAYVTRQIPKQATVNLDEIIQEAMDEGDMIYAKASTTNVLTITLTITTFPAIN